MISLELPGDERGPDAYAAGPLSCGKWVLRLGIEDRFDTAGEAHLP